VSGLVGQSVLTENSPYTCLYPHHCEESISSSLMQPLDIGRDILRAVATRFNISSIEVVPPKALQRKHQERNCQRAFKFLSRF
jgi:hypothetical protein